MSDLTPERRAELRRTLDLLLPARYTSMNVLTAELLALLDTADERDRLQGLIDEVGAHVQWSAESGVTLLEYLDQLCEEAGEAVVAVERVRALTALLDEESAENKKLRALSHDQAERLKELDHLKKEKRAEQVERIKAEHLRIRVQGKSYCAVDGMGWPCLSIRNLEQLSEEIAPSQPCPLPVGDRPYWVSADQWDPCACILLKDHDGPCECSHTVKEN